jgi:hypothetical protein
MSLRALQVVLVACAVAAVVILVSAFPIAVRLGCVGILVAGAAITADERRLAGGGWWLLLGAGAALSVAGLALSEAAETAGGIVALAGALLVVAGSAIGFPLGD